MDNQVVVTTPVRMSIVPPEEALEFLDPDISNPTLGMNVHGQGIMGPSEEDIEDEGEFGLGGDWWKNPQEAIAKIAKIITEDPDINIS